MTTFAQNKVEYKKYQDLFIEKIQLVLHYSRSNSEDDNPTFPSMFEFSISSLFVYSHETIARRNKPKKQQFNFFLRFRIYRIWFLVILVFVIPTFRRQSKRLRHYSCSIWLCDFKLDQSVRRMFSDELAYRVGVVLINVTEEFTHACNVLFWYW